MTRGDCAGVLLDTSFVRDHLVELVELAPKLASRGLPVSIPAPQFAEMLHQRELNVRARSTALRGRNTAFFADAALEPLLEHCAVVPFDEEDARALAAWSARVYGTPTAYGIRKKLVALQKSSDVWVHVLGDTYAPGQSPEEWSKEWYGLYVTAERRVREGSFKKTAPTTADWLMVGMAERRNLWIATGEKAHKGAEFEHCGPRLLELEGLRALAGES